MNDFEKWRYVEREALLKSILGEIVSCPDLRDAWKLAEEGLALFKKEEGDMPTVKEALINANVGKEGEKVFGGFPDFRPHHYCDWELDPYTFVMINRVPFPEADVILYMMRWQKKNGVEDLRKARRIIDMLIELETNRAQYLPERKTL